MPANAIRYKMPHCTYHPCSSEMIPMDGQFLYCAIHHAAMLETDADYRRRVELWDISPEMIETAKTAEMAASRENIHSLDYLIKMCDSESRGEPVDPRLKEEAFRNRWEKVRNWTYTRDVYDELVRAADARNRIRQNAENREKSARIMTNINTYYTRSLHFGRMTNEEETPIQPTNDDRLITEFGM